MRRRIALTAFAAAALALATVPAVAVAGKGGNGGHAAAGAAPITLNESSPALGSWATFSTNYPSNTKNPRVQIMCYQDGNLVYGEAGSPDHAFELGGNPDGGSLWRMAGGAANCQADLFDLYSTGHGQQVDWLGSTTFDAAG